MLWHINHRSQNTQICCQLAMKMLQQVYSLTITQMGRDARYVRGSRMKIHFCSFNCQSNRPHPVTLFTRQARESIESSVTLGLSRAERVNTAWPQSHFLFCVNNVNCIICSYLGAWLSGHSTSTVRSGTTLKGGS